MSTTRTRLRTYFVGPNEQPKKSDFVLASLLVVFGIIFLVSGIINHDGWWIVIGPLWIAIWGLRLALSLMAFRANGLRPPERPRP